jgi:hypothetical protein
MTTPTPPGAPWAPVVRHGLDPRRLVVALDSHSARRRWGHWPVARVILACGIWLAKYGLRRGH